MAALTGLAPSRPEDLQLLGGALRAWRARVAEITSGQAERRPNWPAT
ncbi:hypothetical protein [Actinocrispum wychmicini]|nr:hypothetical protein [Actinocrispum wychmicini]